jgi:hypothetical protein
VSFARCTLNLMINQALVLDPFILNIFPKSLVPTAGYLILVALGAWFLSGTITDFLTGIPSNSALAPTYSKKSD